MITEQESTLLEQCAVLRPKRELSMVEGEQKALQLCSRLNVETAGIVKAFSEFVNDSREFPAILDRHLFKGLVQIEPIRSGEAERGLSKMNIICAPLRFKITIPHFSSLMFDSINRSPMHFWNSSAALSEWL